MFQQTSKGILFNIKVVLKASQTEFVGWENDELKIRLAANPEKGEANKELIHFLARLLKIGKSKIEIVQGETSSHKRICIKEVSLFKIEEKLKKL
jgi:uncharacterized protein (TIGR00251 family)